MANRIKGITVEINGETTGFDKALKNVNTTIKGTQSKLKDVEKLLKLDPSNTEFLAQKQQTLKEKISATEAGQGFEYMAMAGWKTGDMLDGIEGIMNLAAASGEDLGATSDIVTDALTAAFVHGSELLPSTVYGEIYCQSKCRNIRRLRCKRLTLVHGN